MHDPLQTLELRVANLDCEHDATRVKQGFQGFPGLVTLTVYPRAAKLLLTYDPRRTTPEALKKLSPHSGFLSKRRRRMREKFRVFAKFCEKK